jgi:hypothetical protein
MKRANSNGVFCLVLGLVAFVFCSPARAVIQPIWESDASSELTGNRNSLRDIGLNPIGGVDATDGWDNGGLEIGWNIVEDNGIWTYIYTVNIARKDVSHFILEVTEDEASFNILEGTDMDIEGPRTWSPNDPGNANPSLPNDIYGIKFDFGGSPATYTLVTDRAPVYGLFYAKDGKDSGDDVVAWSNALNLSDYKTNLDLTATDFIVRPDSMVVPIPGAVWILGSLLLGFLGFRRKIK